jgi:hypothetical protein
MFSPEERETKSVEIGQLRPQVNTRHTGSDAATWRSGSRASKPCAMQTLGNYHLIDIRRTA